MQAHIKELKKFYYKIFSESFPEEQESKDFKIFESRLPIDLDDAFCLNEADFLTAFENTMEAIEHSLRSHSRSTKIDSCFKQANKEIIGLVLNDETYQQSAIGNKARFRAFNVGMEIEHTTKENNNNANISSVKDIHHKEKNGNGIHEKQIFSTVIQFNANGDFKPKIKSFEGQLISNNHSNYHEFERKTQIFPENYNYDNFLSMNEKSITIGIKDILETFERNHWEYLKSIRYQRPNFNQTLLNSVYLVARIIFNQKEVESKSIASVKMEYLLDNGELGQSLANFVYLEDVFLFSNQTLILKGQFTSEKAFKVETICDSFNNYKQFRPSLEALIDDESTRSFKNNGASNFAVVKGPFLTENLQKYTSDVLNQLSMVIQKIHQVCRESRCSVLLLIGPIIDKTYNLELTKNSLEELHMYFFSNIQKIPNVRYFFISDYNEANNFYPIPVTKFDHHEVHVQLLPNPSLIDFDGFRIAFSNTNLLNELVKQSITRQNLGSPEHLTNCLKNLILSGSLHPIHGHSRRYELSFASQFSVPIWPNVFIFNSDALPEFIEKIDSYVFINVHSFLTLKEGAFISHLNQKSMTATFGSYGVVIYDGQKHSGNEGNQIQVVLLNFEDSFGLF